MIAFATAKLAKKPGSRGKKAASVRKSKHILSLLFIYTFCSGGEPSSEGTCSMLSICVQSISLLEFPFYSFVF